MFIQNRVTNVTTSALVAFALTWVSGYQPAVADTFGKIKGRLINKSTNGSVAFPLMCIDGMQISCQANCRGEYEFPSVEPGTYSITAQLQGWRTAHIPNVVVSPYNTTYVEIRLEEIVDGMVAHLRPRLIAMIFEEFWPLAVPTTENAGGIQGRCSNAWGRDKIEGLTVQIDGQACSAVTDSSGWYALENIPPGIYTIYASMPGLPGLLVKGVEVRAQRMTVVQFSTERYQEGSDGPCD
ncbi:MAG: carboxypeptidase-like regulatory domain-containing protein [Patescibacteria group bacterium]|jgi:hypothetical protein